MHSPLWNLSIVKLYRISYVSIMAGKLSKRQAFHFFPMPHSNISCLGTICPTWRPLSLIGGASVGPWLLIGGAVAATMILIGGAVVETRFLIGGFVPGPAPRATCYSLKITISGSKVSPRLGKQYHYDMKIKLNRISGTKKVQKQRIFGVEGFKHNLNLIGLEFLVV